MKKILTFSYIFAFLLAFPLFASTTQANYTYYQQPGQGYIYPTYYVPHYNNPNMPPTTYTNTNYAVPYNTNQQYNNYYQQNYAAQYRPQPQLYQPPCFYQYYWVNSPQGYRYEIRWSCPPPQYIYR